MLSAARRRVVVGSGSGGVSPCCCRFFFSSPGIQISTSDHIPGYRVQRNLGLVGASVTSSTHVGNDVLARATKLVGGSVPAYSPEVQRATADAMKKLSSKAVELGANAVVNAKSSVRVIVDPAMWSATYFCVMATGDAVVLEHE
jgi:uncharacterized protein YbjQ (UPF0145 family)